MCCFDYSGEKITAEDLEEMEAVLTNLVEERKSLRLKAEVDELNALKEDVEEYQGVSTCVLLQCMSRHVMRGLLDFRAVVV